MLSTKQTFVVGMGEKAHDPLPTDPQFEFRYPTCEEWFEICGLVNEKLSNEEFIRKVLDLLMKFGKVGRNLDAGKSIAALLVPADAVELYHRFRTGAIMRPEQAKNSESPSPTGGGESATADAPTSAQAESAPTPQA